MDAPEKNSLLIVDDDAINLMTLTHFLQADYAIHTAADGESALRQAEEHAPDLILLDILMPGMDGYEMFAALRASERTREIPVIFITGLDNGEEEEKGLALGAADYITKPFRAAIVSLRVHNQITIINQLRTIRRLSMCDQLTGIPNRRSFDERLRAEWARAVREDLPMSIVLIDVDNFKYYNDTYGHPQGDVALQTIIKTISPLFKHPDAFLARWGGEEFAALLSNADVRSGAKVGEEIRAAVENAVIPGIGGVNMKVTVSIGVNAQAPARNGAVEEFLSGADRALYAAKGTGRNRVGLYDGAFAAS